MDMRDTFFIKRGRFCRFDEKQSVASQNSCLCCHCNCKTIFRNSLYPDGMPNSFSCINSHGGASTLNRLVGSLILSVFFSKSKPINPTVI